METTQRWPATAMVAAGVLGVVAAGGWYDVFMQSTAASAASQAAQTQRAGLEARVAAVQQDLSHANAQAQSFATQAKKTGTELAAAQERETALTGQLATVQAQEKRALAEADQQLDALRSLHTGHRAIGARQRSSHASAIPQRHNRQVGEPT